MGRAANRGAAIRRPSLRGAANRGAPIRRAVLLMGPTGAGKSALAVRLAEEFSLEIVSTDSALVYRGMDIGTAKPTAAELGRVTTIGGLLGIKTSALYYKLEKYGIQ